MKIFLLNFLPDTDFCLNKILALLVSLQQRHAVV
ncbi:hypothetical protein AT05_04825 [Schleiferia thermophila str. Yellowstone]|nr:hypothetical protein AT05_04825 [Schleiferia thermophila str. Yellowstone]